jgi:putative ABC transport system permease protein
MSAGVAPWKALVRLAWRDTTRHKGRTALVIALIGVPVAMLLLTSVLTRSTILSLDEKRAVALGPVADLVVRQRLSDSPQTGSNSAPSPSSAGQPSLPAGARAVPLTTSQSIRFWADGHPKRPERAESIAGTFSDPILAGVFLLRSGAWPTTNDGVAVTASLAKFAHLKVGQSVELLAPKRTVNVTGIYERRDDLNSHSFASLTLINDNPTAFTQPEVWIDLGPNITATGARTAAESLLKQGWEPSNLDLLPRSEFRPGLFVGGTTESEATPIAIINVVGLILLFLLGTIVTAAFAVGARRQLRTLGLIAANGGEPRQLQRLVTLQGTVAAAVGALFGFALGAAGLMAVLPHMNRFSHKILPGIEVVPFDIAIAFVMAVVAGSFAAAIPGRTIAKVPVLNALGGRRPMRNVSNSLPIVGIVLAGIGVLLLAAATKPNSIGNAWVAAAAGAIAVLLGGVITAPWLVGRLAPLAGHLSGAPRLAVRRMTRHRGRSGPIVAAIMATGAVTVAVNTMVQSLEKGDKDRYIPSYAVDQVNISFGGYYNSGSGPAPTKAVFDQSIAAASKAVTDVLPGSKVHAYASVTSQFGGPNADGRYYRMAPLAGRKSPSVQSSFDPSVSVVIGNPELLRALHVTDAVIEQFLAGQTIVAVERDANGQGDAPTEVVLLEQKVVNGTPTALVENVVVDGPSTGSSGSQPNERTVRLKAVVVAPIDLGNRSRESVCVDSVCKPVRTTVVVVPEAVAAANDLVGVPVSLVIAAAPLTKDQRAAVNNVRDDIRDAADRDSGFGPFSATTPMIAFEQPSKIPVRIIELISSGLALLLALAVTAVSLALTAVDNRPDDATLASLGAAPGVRRGLRAWEAWLLATSGMTLAVVFGFLPGIAIVRAQGKGDPLVFPWVTGVVLLVAVPLLAAAIGWLSTRSPRRVSTTLAAE